MFIKNLLQIDKDFLFQRDVFPDVGNYLHFCGDLTLTRPLRQLVAYRSLLCSILAQAVAEVTGDSAK